MRGWRAARRQVGVHRPPLPLPTGEGGRGGRRRSRNFRHRVAPERRKRVRDEEACHGVQLVVINDMKTNDLAVAILAQGPARLLLPVLRRGEYQPHP